MRVDRKHDWLINNILALTTNLVGQKVNRLLDFGEVGELLIWHLFELCPRLDIFCRMVQTQLEGTARNDTITSRQEVKTNDRFEHRRLTGRLSTKHGNSRQFDELLKADISQLIDDINELSELLVHETTLVFLSHI